MLVTTARASRVAAVAVSARAVAIRSSTPGVEAAPGSDSIV